MCHNEITANCFSEFDMYLRKILISAFLDQKIVFSVYCMFFLSDCFRWKCYHRFRLMKAKFGNLDASDSVVRLYLYIYISLNYTSTV